ncbi:DUF1320 domain-containing protein [Undibacterium sp. 14-3-2]|uniref:DUF1320 domain-containing protein n=1 Tax=Undibacterium sp. 14-3-2 TaxID=2800129 RepID=UPI001F303FB2|nr:DUF1320 domain-containing protein [Undibacterium sp. 14-3-2]
MVVEAVSQMEGLNSTNRREPYNALLGSGSVLLRSLFNDIAVNLARYWLYTRSTERSDIPEAVIFACKFSEHLPESTLADKLTISMPNGDPVPKLSEIKVRSRVQGFINGMLNNYK